MINKSELRIRAIIAEFEKNNIEKDVSDTNLYLQEYIFIKTFFRVIFLFIISFMSFAFINLKDVIFNQDLLSSSLFLGIFANTIFMSFLICGIYVFLVSLYIKDEYDNKNEKVERYLKAKRYLEKIGEKNE